MTCCSPAPLDCEGVAAREPYCRWPISILSMIIRQRLHWMSFSRRVLAPGVEAGA